MAHETAKLQQAGAAEVARLEAMVAAQKDEAAKMQEEEAVSKDRLAEEKRKNR